MKNLKSLLLLIFYSVCVHGQNLLVNGSAELGDPTSVGWTNVSMGSTGASCYYNSGWRIIESLYGFPAAEQGSYFFYAGCAMTVGSTFELRQDVNVSINASLIDAGWDLFTFSGYMQVYAQTPPDQSQIIVEYRNSTNTIVLASYNTGLVSNQGVWALYTNTQTAPVGTRFIRVRLISKKVNSGSSVDGYFDNLTLLTSIPLPVSLSSFNVVPGNANAKLIWTTSAEYDNSYFTIERSQDANTWIDLEKVQANSNAAFGTTYTAIDNNPIAGISFYRLKITDVNGNSRYSEIKKIDFNNGFDNVIIFPNPAKNSFSIKGEQLKNVLLSLYNSTGQIIIPPFILKDNETNVNISGLGSGTYFVRLTNDSVTQVKKLFVE